MKTKIQLFILIGSVITFSNCKKLTACVESDIVTAKLGQTIKLHNCSIKHEEINFDPNDDSKIYDEGDFDNDELDIEYHTPGVYESTMSVENKSGRKSDKTSMTISIDSPTESELEGDWDYYKVIEEIDFFYLLSDNGTSTSGTLSLNTDKSSNDVNDNIGTWELLSKGRLDLDGNVFEIYELYNGELVLKESDDTVTYLHYYSKK